MTSTSVPLSTFVTMEASADVSTDSGHTAGVYNCFQSGCIHVFQRLSTSERHVSLENCIYRLYQNVLQTLLRVRVGLLLKATSESGESGSLTVYALVPGAQSTGPSSSPGRGPYCVQSGFLHPGV